MLQNDIILSLINKGQLVNLGSIGTESLLLSLMEMEDSMTNLILKELRINQNDILEIIDSYYILRKDNNEFTNELNQVLDDASRLEKNNNYVYDEAYLYSLVNNENMATMILKKLKIDNYVILDELNNALTYLNEDEKLLENVTNLAMQNKLDPFIPTNDILLKIDNVLSKKKKNNCILLGDAGVGKTGIVEGLANYYVKNNIDKIIYRLDITSLLSGTRYRGDLEEKIVNCLDEVKDENTILFIDEIHNITGSNSSENSLDIGNILKPYLARNKIKCIGATTLYEYNKYIYQDKALVRRFQNINVFEPTDNETYKILKGIKATYEEFYGITYSNDILRKIIIASYYILNNNNPDKSIDIMDEIGIIVKRKGRKSVNGNDIKNYIMDNLGINRIKALKKLQNNKYNSLINYINFSNINKYMGLIELSSEEEVKIIIEDLKDILSFKKENILEVDFLDYDYQTLYPSLIGSSNGYIAYDEGGLLTNHILKNNKSIIIFKNYDKLNVKERHLMEKIINNGYLIDNKYNKVKFHNTFVIINRIKNNENIGFK